MPKKLNYGGELQNYVPEGNKHGGEYADDIGSNANYNADGGNDFEKGLKKGFGVKEDKPAVQVSSTDEKGKNDVGGEIDKISDESLKGIFKKAWGGGNEESRKIIDNAPTKIGIEFKPRGASYYSSTDKKVFLAKKIGSDGEWFTNQDTLFHEFGHAIDYTYCSGKKEYFIHIRGLDPIPTKTGVSLSNDYKTSNGMTLGETLKNELKLSVREQMQRDYNREYNENKDFDYQNKVRAKWSNLSDMCEASGGKYGFAFAGYGHGRSYWNKRKDNRATEFFAEAFSAKSSSNKEEYELIKKYLPKTCKAFDEIYDKLSKANGKTILNMGEGEQQ